MEFIERIVGMIKQPNGTTKDINNDPRIEEGLMIVGIYMIFTVISVYVSFTRVVYIGSSAGIDAATFSSAMLFTNIALAIVLPMVSWPVVAGAAHYLSMAFGGNGKFYPNMMTLIGYTAVPLIVTTIISTLLTLLTPVTVIDISGATQAAGPTLVTVFVTIVGIAGSLWAAYLCVFAVRFGEKLTLNNAITVAGILFVLNLIINYGTTIWSLIS